MAGLLESLLSGRSSDIYGEGLLTPEQRGGLGNIGLLALAGKLGQLAGPSFSPVPDFGAALGQAAGAYGASQEGAGTAALSAILTAQKGRKLQQELDFSKQLGPILSKLAGQWPGADGGAGGGEGSGSTGGAATAPLGAGGGGGDISDPLALIEKYESGGRNIMQGVVPPGGGYNPSVGRVTGPSTAQGYYQITNSTWQANAPKAGVDLAQYPNAMSAPKEVQRAVAQKLYDEQGFAPWAPYNPALAAAIRAGGGARGASPAAAAPAPAGGGGLLPAFTTGRAGLLGGATADAGDISAPADVAPNRVGRFAGVAPGTPVNSRGFPYNPEIADPAVAARVAQSMAAIKQAQQSGVPWYAPRETSGGGQGTPAPGQGALAEEPPGFAGRQLVAQLLARSPIDDVSQYRQVAGPGGGDAPGGMASGLLTPGGPLTRGAVPGLPAMPAAAPPSADPSLQLGPLAPAPAAAAPAAAGPGLLAPPGLPAAAALPRVNPAYDAYLRNLAVAGALSEGAGLKNVFGPLTDALKASPAFQAQLEREKARVGVEFAGPKAEAEKAVELRYAGAIAAAVANGQLPSQIVLKNVEAQNDLRNRLASGPVPTQISFDKDGVGTLTPIAGGAEAAANAERLKQEAVAPTARETTRQQQEGAARYEPIPGGVPVMGADGKTTMMPMSRYEYDLRQRLQSERRGAGVPSSGPQPGDIVGTPYMSKEEEQSREIDLKTLESKRATAESARLAIQNANDVQDLIAKGVVMGPGESVRSGLLKLGYALKLTGKDENDLIANTEAFISRQGSELKDALKGLGPPISNIDVQTAGGIAGGKNLTVQGLQELMRIKEKYHRQALTEYNEMAAQAPPGRFDRTIKEPPTYGAKTATGPNGQRMWEKSPGNWVPF